jgi:dTDP-4-dehydrorhamnose reductase
VRWVVAGANGMLGQDLVALLLSRGEQVSGIDRDTVDIVDPAQCDVVAGADVVVNCAAFTAVDAAEAREAEAFAVNAVGAANLARASARHGARMVHISTDYVFDGLASVPYVEDAPTAPRSAYGRTKLAGEWAVRTFAPDHLVVRTAWLYGAHGPCFPRTIARLLAERGAVGVVDDQVGQPTWTRDLAALVLRLVDAGAPAGLYHGTSSGLVSWFGFARAVALAQGLPPETVSPTTTDASARPAPRPAYSALDHGGLLRHGVQPIGDWAERWSVAAAEVLG